MDYAVFHSDWEPGQTLADFAVAVGDMVAVYAPSHLAEPYDRYYKPWTESFAENISDYSGCGGQEPYARYEPSYARPLVSMCGTLLLRQPGIVVPAGTTHRQAAQVLNCLDEINVEICKSFVRRGRFVAADVRGFIGLIPSAIDWVYFSAPYSHKHLIAIAAFAHVEEANLFRAIGASAENFSIHLEY